MSTATIQDLQTYLGGQTIDPDRADLFLRMATTRCTSIVSPLPSGAEDVVLAVAARAFVNPEGVTAETVGPYQVTRAPSTMYLTRDDKATLRRLAGGSSAFSINTLPPGTNAVQLVSVTATAGTFTLSFFGQVSAPISWDASASDLQAALQAIPTVGVGNVAVTGDFTVTFTANLATTPVPTLIADVSDLTGSVTVVTMTQGVFAPGQNLPYWDRSFGHHGFGFR